MRFSPLYIGLLFLVLSGCGSGYKKIDGKWAFVRNDAVDYKVHMMDVDVDTFRVLKSKNYAVDKNHVYRGIMVLDGIDPASYVQFDGSDYSKDKNNAYFGDSVIVDADPRTFKVLGYPYARDANYIFIGCLRMNVESPESFCVIEDKNTDRSVAFIRSKSEVVRMFGEEFQDCTVLFDEQKRDERHTIQVPVRGQATDGKWVYLGPRRSAKVK